MRGREEEIGHMVIIVQAERLAHEDIILFSLLFMCLNIFCNKKLK